MSRIRLVYIGGGSTRAAGTMASLMQMGEDFDGSEVVLVDLVPEHLDIVRRLAERMAAARGLDITVTCTTDRRRALPDADAVLSSFRPGGFEARALDERIPLRHGVIGQETQGPGGFFMALRAVAVLKELCADMEALCPRARLFNYTNPVNIVAQAVTTHSPVPIVSLCEGPIMFPEFLATAAGLDPSRVEATMVGINHACWSTRQRYAGDDLMPLVESAWADEQERPVRDPEARQLLQLAATMNAIPADYFRYYYFRDDILADLQAKPTTRAQDILSWTPDYWDHYAEQAETADPQLDPARSRGGIDELELALDVMDAVFNDKDEVHPVNVPNHGALPGFPDELVVEVPGRCGADWINPLPQAPLPQAVRGLVGALAEYQLLAAETAWHGSRQTAIQALASNPLVATLPLAEALYDELAAAHRQHLPDRLLA